MSGQHPKHPVVSPRSGLVFERAMIERYLERHGNVCPVTKEPLSRDELIEVRVNPEAGARPAEGASVPGMLSALVREWDATLLEMQELREALALARSELTAALYEKDASLRVIARLRRERDEARAALLAPQGHTALAAQAAPLSTAKRPRDEVGGEDAASKRAAPSAETAAGMSVESAAASGGGSGDDDVATRMLACAKELAAQRQKFRVEEGAADASAVARLELADSYSPHLQSKRGVTCLDVAWQNPDGGDLRVVTGGVDAKVALSDPRSKKVLMRYSEHKGAVTDVCFSGRGDTARFASTGSDGALRVWDAGHKSSVATVDAAEGRGLAAVAAAPVPGIFVCGRADGGWALVDADRGATVHGSDGAGAAMGAAALHPDGVLYAVADDSGTVALWDLRTRRSVAMCGAGPTHAGAARGVGFSERSGVWVFSCSADELCLWDLRRPSAAAGRAALPAAGGRGGRLSVDRATGRHVAVAGDGGVSVFHVGEDVSVGFLRVFDVRGSTAAAYGPRSASLYASSSDNYVYVYGVA